MLLLIRVICLILLNAHLAFIQKTLAFFPLVNGILCVKRFLNIKVIPEIDCPLSANP